MLKILRLWAILNLTILSGCAPIKELPNPDQATAIEQFLITQAVNLSLNNEYPTPLPLQPEKTVTLDTTDLTVEKRFFSGALGQWLGEQGLLLTPEGKHANYRIQVLIQALGTEQSQSFLGMPPVQSVLIPFALPEITLYKAQYQTGYTRSGSIFPKTRQRNLFVPLHGLRQPLISTNRPYSFSLVFTKRI
ncbi:MAG: hypothetical protein H0W49_16575 [Nitrospirales bacterium]|nr:hypothetical protein [Nitrospirales bacterium]